ncbi:MAG: ECF transporter S component, partial [Oscillospiraceae bacterium]
MKTKTMEKTKNLVISALCIALGVILPIAFHAIPNAGSIFLPMHIPVLLCGLICGPIYGLVCG